MTKKSNHAQSEIMGLAVVMLIITFGLLLYISFSLKTQEKALSTEFSYKQLPITLNNAILETHTTEEDCYGEKIQKLLLKAAEGNTLICKNGKSAKVFSEQIIKQFLDKTLDEWHIEYKYIVYKGTDFTDAENYLMYITNSEDDCKNKDINTENFFFRMSNGQFLNIKLDLCS